MVQNNQSPRLTIFHPSITEIGGVERLADLLARELPSQIHTPYAIPNIENFLPETLERLRITGKTRFTRFRGMISFNPRAYALDMLIYIAPSSIYHTIFHRGFPYLYYLTTPPRRTFVEGGKSVQQRLHWSKDIFWRMYVKNRIRADWTVLISKTSYNRFCRVTGRKPRGYAYPPVETSRYLWRPSEDYFLSVNRLEPMKRADWQIDAFAKSKERLLIVGDGSQRRRLRSKIKEENLENVTLLGGVGDRELRSLYSRCKGLIYTTREDEFGLVCVESLASGKPVFTVKEGGPTEYIVDGENGFLFDDPEHLATKLDGFQAKDSDRMRRACERTAEKFNPKATVPKLRNLVTEIWQEAHA